MIKNFEHTAHFNAGIEGIKGMAVVSLPGAYVPQAAELERTNMGAFVIERVLAAITSKAGTSSEKVEDDAENLKFAGADYPDALANMEQLFLERRWSDGFPLVAPTRRAVDAMLEATDLKPDECLGLMEPARRLATVEKLAINAVMAGCLPLYFPVILAAVRALIDPRFDLRGVQSTAGMVCPLFIISGPKLIDELNVNDSYSTIGPGWKANSSIGRALRLILTNIGGAWPGRTDMKSFGSPYRFGILFAENDAVYGDDWEPLRVTQGFSRDEPTISVMPAVGWSPDFITADRVNLDVVVKVLVDQGRMKYDRKGHFWGKDNLILLSWSTFRAIRNSGISRAELQQKLFEQIQIPAREFYDDKEAYSEAPGALEIPLDVVERARKNPDSLIPLLAAPQNIKIVAAGGPGPAMVAFISTWGAGPAYFVTKPIPLPGSWPTLVEKYRGGRTAVVR